MTINKVNAVLESMIRLSRILMEQLSTAKTITGTQIVSCQSLLPKWESGIAVKESQCYTYQDKVYRVNKGQGHTTQDDWTPDKTPAMWTIIDVEHAGTSEDPIPASRGMEYEYGKYYSDPEDNQVYLCKRTGESEGGKIVLQYLPHELVGQYFELTTTE